MTAALQRDEMTIRQARKLLELLKQHWNNFERTLEEIADRRAWEPLGYASFPEMWAAEMSDFTLFPELRAHVVYAYFDAGATVNEVANGVKGVGPARAAALKRQRDNGVPSGSASLNSRWHNKPADETIVREHLRKKPAEASTIHISLAPLKYKRYQKLAKKAGIALEDICREAIDEKFKQLA